MAGGAGQRAGRSSRRASTSPGPSSARSRSRRSSPVSAGCSWPSRSRTLSPTSFVVHRAPWSRWRSPTWPGCRASAAPCSPGRWRRPGSTPRSSNDITGGDANTYVFAISGLALIVTAIAAPEGITGLVRTGVARLGRSTVPPEPPRSASRPWTRRRAMSLLEVDRSDREARRPRRARRRRMSASTTGQIVGLIGPNGAGKTTFIDTLTGFTAPHRGQITFDGLDITRVSPHHRAQAGLVRTFQSLELFDDLSVRDNLLVAAHTPTLWSTLTDALWPKVHDNRETHAVVELLDLGPVADRLPTELSNGQRHVVALGRALVASPKLVLLDEPAAGLDPTETAELAVMLRRLPGVGTTVLVVDHDMSLILGVCDIVHVLDFGHLLASGTAGRGPPRPHGHRRLPRPAGAARGGPTVSAGELLRLEGVTAGYDGIAVDPRRRPRGGAGEVVALLGSNGAGKTTTLLAISGLVPAGGAGSPCSVVRSTRDGAAPRRRRVAPGPLGGRPRPRGSRAVLRPHRRREPPPRSSRGAARRVPMDQVLAWFPALEKVLGPQGRPAVGRRAADAGAGPGRVVRASPPAGRRAQPRPGTDHRRAAAPGAPVHRHGDRGRGSSSSSSTCPWCSRSPIGPICCARVG